MLILLRCLSAMLLFIGSLSFINLYGEFIDIPPRRRNLYYWLGWFFAVAFGIQLMVIFS